MASEQTHSLPFIPGDETATPVTRTPALRPEQSIEQQMFLPTPLEAGSSNTDLFTNTAPHGPSPWHGSEDLFALLTSDPSQWIVNPELAFADVSFMDPSADQPGEVQQPYGSSYRARHAMQNMSNMIQDLSFSLAREVESTGVTADFLDTCLSVFFSRFVAVFPVVHQPTFSLKDCTAPLLLNMIALGSLFVASEGATAKGEALWRLAHTAVATSWQSMLDHAGHGDQTKGVQLVMTALLGQSYAVLSSNRSIRLTSHVFHELGFYWARQSGMAVTSSLSDALPDLQSSASVQTARWRSWAAREVQNRALLGHYVLDGFISQSSGLPNSARHTTNNLIIPSSDEAFEADSADTWLAAMQNEHQVPVLTFRELLNGLFDAGDQYVETFLPHMAVPVVMEAVQSLVSESHEANGPSVGTPSQAAISKALWRLYKYHITDDRRPGCDMLDLSIRWHVVCISLCVEPGTLVCSLCEMYGVQQALYSRHGLVSYTQFDINSWRGSHLARRAVLHALSVLDLIQRLPLGKIQALHLPLALYTAATVLIAVSSADASKMTLPWSVRLDSEHPARYQYAPDDPWLIDIDMGRCKGNVRSIATADECVPA